MEASKVTDEKIPTACPACGASLRGVECSSKGILGKYRCGSEWLLHLHCVKPCPAAPERAASPAPPAPGNPFCR